MGPRQLGKRPANKCCRPDPTGVLRGTHSPPSQHSNGQARAGDYGGFERQGGLPVLAYPARKAGSIRSRSTIVGGRPWFGSSYGDRYHQV